MLAMCWKPQSWCTELHSIRNTQSRFCGSSLQIDKITDIRHKIPVNWLNPLSPALPRYCCKLWPQAVNCMLTMRVVRAKTILRDSRQLFGVNKSSYFWGASVLFLSAGVANHGSLELVGGHQHFDCALITNNVFINITLAQIKREKKMLYTVYSVRREE